MYYLLDKSTDILNILNLQSKNNRSTEDKNIHMNLEYMNKTDLSKLIIFVFSLYACPILVKIHFIIHSNATKCIQLENNKQVKRLIQF